MKNKLIGVVVAVLAILSLVLVTGAASQTAPTRPNHCDYARELEEWLNRVQPANSAETNERTRLQGMNAEVLAACNTTTTTTAPPTTTTTAPPTTTTTVPPTTTTTAPPSSTFPTPANTGPTTGSNPIADGWVPLQTVNGNLTVTVANTVLDRVHVTGAVNVRASGVIIRNSWIGDGINNQGGVCNTTQSFTVEDTQIGSPTDNSSLDYGLGCGAFTARRNEIYAHDLFRNSGTAAVLIEDNFGRNVPTSDPDPHYDGYQGFGGGSAVTLRHNTIDMRGLSNGVTGQLFAADGARGYRAEDNLLLGSSIAIRMNDDISSDDGGPILWIAAGNRMDAAGSGAGSFQLNCATEVTWTDNRIATIDANYNVTSLGSTVACPNS